MRKLVRGTTKTHALSLACLWKHNTSPPQKTAEGGCATALQAAQNNRHALGADLRLGVRFTPRVEGSMFLLLYPGLFL
jgi:hypothetical protein